MKLKNILISGLGVMALTACNDFLEVDAPSSYTTELVYGTVETANTALNGVYAKMLSDNTFGRYLYSDAMLNSDVDFVTNTNENSQSNAPRRFDLDAGSSVAKNLWNQLYATIESANMFITSCEASAISKGDKASQVKQMIGEAKVMRAACYSELMWYFGDVPFTFTPTMESNQLNPDVATREEIAKKLIADLEASVEDMQVAPANGVERIGKDAACAMIARLALQAGGYYLSHNAGDSKGYKMVRSANYLDFYKKAQKYAQMVKDGGRHSLGQSYRNVFVKECNFEVVENDDPIWEIPFAKETSGQFGNYQGPIVKGEDEGTLHNWGKTDGSVRTTAFYRFSFDPQDTRREYICGSTQYTATNLPSTMIDYTMQNNKWSKLWNTAGLGATTEGNTGINFAYIRYADVLLMLAEAENEINGGPTDLAIECVRQVRARAYRGSGYDYTAAITAATSKESFLRLVLSERAKEFAGENMRWKDLVRNNLYSEVIFYTFLTYYSIAENQVGTAPAMDRVNEYWEKKWSWKFTKADGTDTQFDFSANFPTDYYYCYIKNCTDSIAKYPALKQHTGDMPNTGLAQLYLANFYGETSVKPSSAPNLYDFGTSELGDIALTASEVTGKDTDSKKYEWGTTSLTWTDSNSGMPKAQVMFSLYGFIRSNISSGVISIVTPQGEQRIDPASYEVSDLPAVRYLMPYPKEAIARSGGKYSQNYGY